MSYPNFRKEKPLDLEASIINDELPKTPFWRVITQATLAEEAFQKCEIPYAWMLCDLDWSNELDQCLIQRPVEYLKINIATAPSHLTLEPWPEVWYLDLSGLEPAPFELIAKTPSIRVLDVRETIIDPLHAWTPLLDTLEILDLRGSYLGKEIDLSHLSSLRLVIADAKTQLLERLKLHSNTRLVLKEKPF